jgi:hypothetical protein
VDEQSLPIDELPAADAAEIPIVLAHREVATDVVPHIVFLTLALHIPQMTSLPDGFTCFM